MYDTMYGVLPPTSAASTQIKLASDCARDESRPLIAVEAEIDGVPLRLHDGPAVIESLDCAVPLSIGSPERVSSRKSLQASRLKEMVPTSGRLLWRMTAPHDVRATSTHFKPSPLQETGPTNPISQRRRYIHHGRSPQGQPPPPTDQAPPVMGELINEQERAHERALSSHAPWTALLTTAIERLHALPVPT